MPFRTLEKGFRKLAVSPIPQKSAEKEPVLNAVVERVNNQKHIEPQERVVEKVRTEVIKVEVPAQQKSEQLDYDKLAKVIKDNLHVSVYGGGGIQHTLNTRGVAVNPATEEKQQEIINAVQGIGGGGGLSGYVLTHDDQATATEYYGYENADGGWVIKKYTDGVATYTTNAESEDNLATAWASRAGFTYEAYSTVF